MKLVSTVSWSAFATVVRLANGFVSMKIVAMLIGPVGIALTGQFANFNSIVMTLALGGISSGVIKYTAQYRDNIEELRKIWHTISWISGMLMIPVILILFIFHKWFALYLLHDLAYGSIFIVFGFSLIFYVLNNLLLNILNGMHDIKIYTILNTLNSTLGLLVTIGLVYNYKIYGALLAMVTSQSITFFLVLFFVKNKDWFQIKNFIGKFNKLYFYKLMNFTIISFTVICVTPTSQMFVRSYLADKTSWDIVGCWQGMQKISDSYLMIVYAAFGTYFLPKLAALNNKHDIGKEIRRGYLVIMPFIITSVVLIYFLRDFIINLLFTNSFRAMRDMFFWQLIGDCFRIASYLLTYLMLAKAKTKIAMSSEIISGVTFSLLSYLLINNIGSNGAVIAFALNYFCYFILFVILYKKEYLF